MENTENSGKIPSQARLWLEQLDLGILLAANKFPYGTIMCPSLLPIRLLLELEHERVLTGGKIKGKKLSSLPALLFHTCVRGVLELLIRHFPKSILEVIGYQQTIKNRKNKNKFLKRRKKRRDCPSFVATTWSTFNWLGIKQTPDVIIQIY